VHSTNGGTGNTASTGVMVAAPTPSPSVAPAASESAAETPGEAATPAVAVTATASADALVQSSPSPAPGTPGSKDGGGVSTLFLVSLSVIVVLGLAGLLAGLLFWHSRGKA
jgi:hypothetical protein